MSAHPFLSLCVLLCLIGALASGTSSCAADWVVALDTPAGDDPNAVDPPKIVQVESSDTVPAIVLTDRSHIESVHMTPGPAASRARNLREFLRDVFIRLIPTAIVSYAAIRFGYFDWRRRNFVDKWYEIMRFLHENPRFMDKKKNDNYKIEYSGYDKWKYESIARMCIAYVDDMYHLGYAKHSEEWFPGVIPLFVGRHHQWFKDNPKSYSEKFRTFVTEKMEANQNAP